MRMSSLRKSLYVPIYVNPILAIDVNTKWQSFEKKCSTVVIHGICVLCSIHVNFCLSFLSMIQNALVRICVCLLHNSYVSVPNEMLHHPVSDSIQSCPNVYVQAGHIHRQEWREGENVVSVQAIAKICVRLRIISPEFRR